MKNRCVEFYKILKVDSKIVARVIEYIESLTYQTYSPKLKENVTRNSFSILKLEATHTGTNIWLEGFGRMRETRYENLKTFIQNTEGMLNERENSKVHA